MSDTGWTAIAAMVASVCSLLGALFARQAAHQTRETAEKIEAHEEASAERGRILRAEVAPGRRIDA